MIAHYNRAKTNGDTDMNSDWQNFLSARGARFAGPEITDFGQTDAELQAAAATVMSPLTHLAVIACDGDDAKSFLHNQLTSDINHLEAGAAQHSAWCTAKGRMLASFIVWREGEGYRLALSAELLEPILKRLKMYVLRSKVQLADCSHDSVILGVSGPQAAAALAAAGLRVPDAKLATVAGDDMRVIRLDEQRLLIIGHPARLQERWPTLTGHARPVGLPVWRWLDIQAALPLVTAATREEFVPQMADFEKIGGVSFHKGCYPGQEVVARTQYLGKVKRHLFRVSSASPLVAGDDLHSPDNPDQAIGKIVSAAPAPQGGFAALAVIQSNFAASARLKAVDGPQLESSAVNPLE